MVLFFHDIAANTMAIEMHKARQGMLEKPNERWKTYALVKANGWLDNIS